MDPQEYADARWHSLLRAAVDLGVPEDDAPALVRRVLAAQRRQIRRADDPDPIVQAALAQELRGPEPPRRPPWRALTGVIAAGAVVIAAVALTRPDDLPTDHLDGDQVPSLFGFGRVPAQQLLAGLGLEVTVEPTRACEVADRVVGTDPGPGAAYDRGDAITLYTAVPANITCLTDYQQRAVAWQLIDLAAGRGSGPAFADQVVLDFGGGSPTVLTAEEATDPEAWAGSGALAAVRAAASQVRLTDDRPPTYAVPALKIAQDDEDSGECGGTTTVGDGAGDAFTVLLVPPARAGCSIRLDDVRRDTAHRVSGVVVYAGSS